MQYYNSVLTSNQFLYILSTFEQSEHAGLNQMFSDGLGIQANLSEQWGKRETLVLAL